MRTVAITDCRISPDAERRLTLLGFRVITLPPYKTLPEAVASHTDMLIAKIGNEFITTADYCEVAPWVFTDLYDLTRGRGIRVSFTSDELGGRYPYDCLLNVLVMGEYIFAKTDTVSPYILERAKAQGFRVIHVNQGYPACTVLRLDDKHAITADRGMARAMREVGITVYEIRDGDISLPPHEYGFIGGCAGVHRGRIYFNGNPETHRDFEIIRGACQECHLEIVSLTGGMLSDLGGFIFAEGDL